MGIFRDKYGNIKPRSFIKAFALAVAATIGGCNILNNYEYSSGSRTGVE